MGKTKFPKRWYGFQSLALPVLAISCVVQSSSAPGNVDFERDVLPVFKQSCAPCHITSMLGGLRLDSEDAVLRGGQHGPAVSPGNSNDSLLVKRILGLTEAPRMPMGGPPLPQAEVELIRSWIDQNNFSRHEKAIPQADSKAAIATGSPQAGSAMFAKQVRPVFAARCYSCHGPEIQQNGLRLDSLASILKGSDYGPVVIPGKSGDSRLIHRLLAKERPQMPYGGPPLSQAEIQIIAQWIDAGAPGPDDATPIAAGKIRKHWAYMKPVQPEIPAVKDSAWVRNPIDSFILARLEKEGLKPAPEADRATLIRRVYLDLTGLPPPPSEVQAFLRDRSAGAYERVVDRLFASPHYGEHWARQWLDFARYADSNGYEKDRKREAWTYRDWVIRALNANMSFREFTIDQIAGDMLPDPTRDQLIGTGFNRNSMLNQEGGIDVNEYYYYSQVDRVNTTASVWLGSTLGCAQCHNHKFDPFTQKDYYRFLAFFNNGQHEVTGKGDHWMKEPEIELPTPEQEEAGKALRADIEKLKEKLRTQTPELAEAQLAWEADLKRAENDWKILTPVKFQSVGGATLKLMDDGSLLATGRNPQADTYVIEARTNTSDDTAIRLEVLPDASLPRGGPGRDPAGNFFLSDFKVEAAPASNPAAFTRLAFKKAYADEAQEDYEIEQLLKKKKSDQITGWAIDESGNAPLRRQAVFVSPTHFRNEAGVVLRITLSHQMRHASRNIGRFRLSLTSSAEPQFITQIPAKLRPLIDTPASDRNDEQRRDLADAYREVSPLLEPARKQIEELEKQVKALGIATGMVMREQPTFTRPSAYIRERGTFTSPGELVYADVPFALGSLPKDAMPNRLGLAEWLVSEGNPLTARVTVNHFWEALFGRGIVETAEDFGTQGDPPSNPELLDWLAVQFVKNGWDMKRIQRLIVTSATYRQSSGVTPDLLARDPYNRLYARGARFRLDAETVHDAALAIGGLLNEKLYGPPVFPYQPDGIWNIPYSDDKWIESSGEERYRRAIYTFIRRSAPYPSLVTYDAPSREFCTVRRVRTNTPLQALTSLNDPFFFEAARGMAKRVLTEGGNSVTDRINYAFLLTVARRPTPSESKRVLAFFNKQVREYSTDVDSAWQALALKPGSVPNPAELAAWTLVSNALLNTDEAITRE